MNLRVATSADAAGIAELAIGFRKHLQRSAPSDEQFRAGIGRLLASEDAQFCVCDVDGRTVAYVLQRFRYSMWVAGLEATIEDLFVDPACRGSGIGGQLVAYALDRARARGCSTACLDTNEHNTASQRIYQALGFSAFSPRWNGNQVFYRARLA